MQRNRFLIKQQMMEIAQKWTMAALFSSLKTERTGNKTYRTRTKPGLDGCVRLHRGASITQAKALDDRLSELYGVRAEGWIRLTACHPNRVQANSTLLAAKARDPDIKRQQPMAASSGSG